MQPRNSIIVTNTNV